MVLLGTWKQQLIFKDMKIISDPVYIFSNSNKKRDVGYMSVRQRPNNIEKANRHSIFNKVHSSSKTTRCLWKIKYLLLLKNAI